MRKHIASRATAQGEPARKVPAAILESSSGALWIAQLRAAAASVETAPAGEHLPTVASLGAITFGWRCDRPGAGDLARHILIGLQPSISGSVNQKVAPLPGALITPIWPPCRSIIERQI